MLLQNLSHISENYSSFKTFVNIYPVCMIILIDWIPQFSFLMRFFCHCKSSYHIEGMMRGQLQVRKASIVTWSKSFTINCNYPASTQNRNITKSSPELVNNLHLHSIKTQKKGDAFVATVWKNTKFTLTWKIFRENDLQWNSVKYK